MDDFDFTPRAFNPLIITLRKESAARVPPGEALKEFSLGTLDSALRKEKKHPEGMLIRRLSNRKFLVTFAPDPQTSIQNIVDLLNYQEHVEKAEGMPAWWTENSSLVWLAGERK